MNFTVEFLLFHTWRVDPATLSSNFLGTNYTNSFTNKVSKVFRKPPNVSFSPDVAYYPHRFAPRWRTEVKNLTKGDLHLTKFPRISHLRILIFAKSAISPWHTVVHVNSSVTEVAIIFPPHVLSPLGHFNAILLLVLSMAQQLIDIEIQRLGPMGLYRSWQSYNRASLRTKPEFRTRAYYK